jgi:hypothetical protein
LALDFSSEVVLNVCVPDQAAKVRKLRVLLKKSLAFQLRKDGSRRRDFQAAALEKDTVDTLASAITSSQRIVEIELAVAVSTSTVARSSAEREKAEQDLAQRVESVLQAFGQINGARGYREETALLPTFIAFLPGVHGVRKTNREFTMLSGQAADFVPIETPWTGTHDGKPAFLTRTREGTFLRFDPFSRELSNGNILVTGKTGSGKSFLIKQLLLQLQVLNPRIAIVTKGADYRALVELRRTRLGPDRRRRLTCGSHGRQDRLRRFRHAELSREGRSDDVRAPSRHRDDTPLLRSEMDLGALPVRERSD